MDTGCAKGSEEVAVGCPNVAPADPKVAGAAWPNIGCVVATEDLPNVNSEDELSEVDVDVDAPNAKLGPDDPEKLNVVDEGVIFPNDFTTEDVDVMPDPKFDDGVSDLLNAVPVDTTADDLATPNVAELTELAPNNNAGVVVEAVFTLAAPKGWADVVPNGIDVEEN